MRPVQTICAGSWSTAMSIILGVEVQNFRSIRQLRVSGFQNYNPIIGLNSSGKSNLLRALNVFFNDVVDQDDGVMDLNRDYSDYAPKGKKKSISIAVDITLEEPIKIRGQDEFLKNNQVQGHIVIQKNWSYENAQSRSSTVTYSFGTRFEDLRQATSVDVSSLQAIIRSIIFRYISNHTRPANAITDLLNILRPELVARLQASREYRDSSIDDIISGLSRMGNAMFSDVSSQLNAGVHGLTVKPTLPSSFADLLFDVSLSSISDVGVARPPSMEGSGTQTFMLLHVLNLADRAERGRAFGWIQATVWAFEEPESFLHAGLRSRYSVDLLKFSSTDQRRQVFTTTHADEFVRIGGAAFVADRVDSGTALERKSAKDALRDTSRKAISVYAHPLMANIDVPVVLVEGKYDYIYLMAAIREANFRPRWRVASPDEYLTPGSAGDALLNYIRWNQQVLEARPDASPIFVLRDWEDENKKVKFDEYLKCHPHSRALVCPTERCNNQLGQSFVGIERYLTVDAFAEAVGLNNLGKSPVSSGSQFTIDRKLFESSKSSLAQAVINGRPVGNFMVELARWLDDRIEQELNGIPADAFF